MMAASAPVPDHESAPWWQALREHRLTVQICTTCRHRWLPRTPGCPYCGATTLDDVDAPGPGTVYSYVRAHRPMSPAMAEETPYTIAAVDLDGGGRVFARVEGDDIHIGMRVEPRFVDHDGWTELRMAPSGVTGPEGSGR